MIWCLIRTYPSNNSKGEHTSCPLVETINPPVRVLPYLRDGLLLSDCPDPFREDEESSSTRLTRWGKSTWVPPGRSSLEPFSEKYHPPRPANRGDVISRPEPAAGLRDMGRADAGDGEPAPREPREKRPSTGLECPGRSIPRPSALRPVCPPKSPFPAGLAPPPLPLNVINCSPERSNCNAENQSGAFLMARRPKRKMRARLHNRRMSAPVDAAPVALVSPDLAAKKRCPMCGGSLVCDIETGDYECGAGGPAGCGFGCSGSVVENDPDTFR